MAKDVDTTDGTATALRPTEKFIDYLTRKAEEDSTNRNYEIAASQLDRILSAETLQEMWDADDFESQGGRDLVDIEIQINSFTVHPSDGNFTTPLGHWVMVSAQRLSDGTEIVFNTGAPLIMGKMRWLEAQDLLGKPEAQCVIRSKETPNGAVLKLKPIALRAVNG